MSESAPFVVPADVKRIIAGTRQAYATSAREYATATRDYATYPSLRDEIVGFEKMLLAGRPVLDLGCGGGRDSRLLADLGRTVIAGDSCLPMLKSARELAPDGTYMHLDMLALPFSDGALGGIWASGSMLHLPSVQIPQALSEVSRTLVTGGVAAISMKAGEHQGWREGGSLPGRRWFTYVRPPAFAAAMSAAGFGDVRTQFSGRPGWFIALGRRI
jgi:SAM-dependent methyltransferase